MKFPSDAEKRLLVNDEPGVVANSLQAREVRCIYSWSRGYFFLYCGVRV
jgi:hypothetical protein